MKLSVLIVFVALLGACGFQPMYGTHADRNIGAREGLSVVDISNIANRDGQYLRNALIDRFYEEGRPEAPRYILSVGALTETSFDLDVTKTSGATRAQLKISTSLTLEDVGSKEVVLERHITSISSYNVLTSEFATRVSRQNARENTLDDIARQIEAQLVLYFNRMR